jgi:hypothetical protein
MKTEDDILAVAKQLMGVAKQGGTCWTAASFPLHGHTVKFLLWDVKHTRPRKLPSRGSYKRLSKLQRETEQPFLIIYDDSYQQIDFLMQVVVHLLQRGIVEADPWVMSTFREYLKHMEDFRPSEEWIRRIKEVTDEHKEEKLPPWDGKKESDGLTHEWSRQKRRFKSKWGFYLPTEDTAEDTEEDTDSEKKELEEFLSRGLKYIVGGYFAPTSAKSFGVYVRKTMVGCRLQAAGRSGDRNKIREYKRKTPVDLDRLLKKEVISKYAKQRGIKQDSARKWLQRQLKSESLAVIITKLF